MKKIIALVVMSMLMVTTVPQAAFATSGTDTWDGNPDTSWYNASETSFTIDTAEELAGLAQIVNAGADTFDNKTITLTRNLDLAGHGWTPIGIETNPFLGTFDGGNHTISNMKIDESSSSEYLGLFGVAAIPGAYPDNGATLKNISVLNVDVLGGRNVGGLVGFIGDLSVPQTSFIINCHTSGKVSGSYDVGGLVGTGSCSIIENSSSSAAVKGTDDRLGGLAGFAAYATIKNSFATGDVEGNSDESDSVGGLVGDALSNESRDSIIENSYAIGAVVGKSNVGGLLGSASSVGTKITNSYATGTVTGTYNTGGLYGSYQTTPPTTTNSYGNNANVLKKDSTDKTTYGSHGSVYTEAGATLDQMKEVDFKNTLNGDSAALEPFAIDPDFNNGFPYLATIPQIISGDGQTISQGQPLIIKATFPYVEGMVITKVGGVAVPAGMVTYAPGSTIVTLSEEYTATLGVGTYSIEIANLDYGTAIGTFTVVAGPEPTPVPVPQTGDNTNLYGLIAIAIISILGAYVVVRRRNRV